MFGKLGSAAVTLLVLATAPAGAASLKIGDTAPPLQIAHWVKGQPVELGAKGNDKVVLVEFWATWCPPCIQSIPHLTELQKKYKDKLVIVSITDEDKASVKRFVERQGKKMEYTVAVDERMKTSTAYMLASGQQGIPTAYILTPDNRIAWIGHPLLGMDEVLQAVISGKYDIEQAAAEAEADERFYETRHLVLFSAVQSGDWATALKIAREVADPNHRSSKALKKDILENVAWLVLTDDNGQEKFSKDALQLARAAMELTEGKDGSVLDTYALALFENGEVDEAIEHARKALEMVDEPILRIQINERLRRYQKSQATP